MVLQEQTANMQNYDVLFGEKRVYKSFIDQCKLRSTSVRKRTYPIWRQEYNTMQIFECVKIIVTCILLFDLTFAEPLVNRFATRRKSVFAETYDPENDADEDEGAAAIFPKSDEQRTRLIESVKNILLFRSLDKEQVRVPNVDFATAAKAVVCVCLAWRCVYRTNDTCVYSLI